MINEKETLFKKKFFSSPNERNAIVNYEGDLGNLQKKPKINQVNQNVKIENIIFNNQDKSENLNEQNLNLKGHRLINSDYLLSCNNSNSNIIYSNDNKVIEKVLNQFEVPIYGRKNSNIKEFLLINSAMKTQNLVKKTNRTNNNNKFDSLLKSSGDNFLSGNLNNNSHLASCGHLCRDLSPRLNQEKIEGIILSTDDDITRCKKHHCICETKIRPHSLERNYKDMGKVDLSDVYFIRSKRLSLKKIYKLKWVEGQLKTVSHILTKKEKNMDERNMDLKKDKHTTKNPKVNHNQNYLHNFDDEEPVNDQLNNSFIKDPETSSQNNSQILVPGGSENYNYNKIFKSKYTPIVCSTNLKMNQKKSITQKVDKYTNKNYYIGDKEVNKNSNENINNKQNDDEQTNNIINNMQTQTIDNYEYNNQNKNLLSNINSNNTLNRNDDKENSPKSSYYNIVNENKFEISGLNKKNSPTVSRISASENNTEERKNSKINNSSDMNEINKILNKDNKTISSYSVKNLDKFLTNKNNKTYLGFKSESSTKNKIKKIEVHVNNILNDDQKNNNNRIENIIDDSAEKKSQNIYNFNEFTKYDLKEKEKSLKLKIDMLKENFNKSNNKNNHNFEKNVSYKTFSNNKYFEKSPKSSDKNFSDFNNPILNNYNTNYNLMNKTFSQTNNFNLENQMNSSKTNWKEKRDHLISKGKLFEDTKNKNIQFKNNRYYKVNYHDLYEEILKKDETDEVNQFSNIKTENLVNPTNNLKYFNEFERGKEKIKQTKDRTTKLLNEIIFNNREKANTQRSKPDLVDKIIEKYNLNDELEIGRRENNFKKEIELLEEDLKKFENYSCLKEKYNRNENNIYKENKINNTQIESKENIQFAMEKMKYKFNDIGSRISKNDSNLGPCASYDKAKLFFNLDEQKERFLPYRSNYVEFLEDSKSFITLHKKSPHREESFIQNKNITCSIYPSNEIDWVETHHNNKILEKLSKYY
jgi:hypothetical protein